MAKMIVCAIFDKKAEGYQPPFFVPARGIATRDFSDAFTSSDSKMAKHKDDFDLYEVAEFDTNDGSFVSVIPPRLMFKGSDIGE